jgi:hypothetical protein
MPLTSEKSYQPQARKEPTICDGCTLLCSECAFPRPLMITIRELWQRGLIQHRYDIDIAEESRLTRKDADATHRRNA